MSNRATFSDEEWHLLVRLPRWVVRAASASQNDSARRTSIELEAGFLSVAEGRALGSDLVATIAQQALDAFDAPQTGPEHAGISFTDVEAGLAGVIERAQAAVAIVAAKAPADAAAYRRWLLRISDVVVSAARSHDRFGMGGVYVTESELAFDRRLELALGE